MFFIKSAFCRVFQIVFHIALPILPYREPEIVNSCNDIGSVLKNKNIDIFLSTLPHYYYEENNLHAFLIERVPLPVTSGFQV